MIHSMKNIVLLKVSHSLNRFEIKRIEYKGDVLLEFSSVKWVLNEDHTLYCNLLGTLLLQNFVLDNSYFINFFVGQTTVEIEGIQKIGIK